MPSAYAPWVGGIEEIAARLAGYLMGSGHEVDVITNRWPADLPEDEVLDGVTVHRIDMPAPGLNPARTAHYLASAPRTLARLNEMASAFPPDLVHAVGASWQAYHGHRLARVRGLPFVLTLQGETLFDDHGLYQSGMRSALVRRALRSMAKSAAAVTACSRLVVEDGSAIAPRLSRAEVVPNGVDIEAFASVPPPGGDGTVAAIGRLVPVKGFDLLLRAWPLVEGGRLLIGGDGSMRAELEEIATPMGERVEFLGRLDRDAVRQTLAGSSALVMPSRREPFGMVALEAMAAGRPVVVSSVSGAAEFAKGAILVDPADANALAGAIEQALAHPELGEEGREVARNYDWSLIGARYLEIYERVAA